MTPALVLVPAVAGIMSFSWRGDYARRALLLAAAILHAVLTVLSWRVAAPPGPDAWLGLDSLGLYFLSVVSGLFLVASFAVFLGFRPLARRLDAALPDVAGIGSNRLIGVTGSVISAIPATPGAAGMVRVGAEDWRADTVDEIALPVGARVRVLEVRGTRLVVEPVEPVGPFQLSEPR